MALNILYVNVKSLTKSRTEQKHWLCRSRSSNSDLAIGFGLFVISSLMRFFLLKLLFYIVLSDILHLSRLNWKTTSEIRMGHLFNAHLMLFFKPLLQKFFSKLGQFCNTWNFKNEVRNLKAFWKVYKLKHFND